MVVLEQARKTAIAVLKDLKVLPNRIPGRERAINSYSQAVALL